MAQTIACSNGRPTRQCANVSESHNPMACSPGQRLGLPADMHVTCVNLPRIDVCTSAFSSGSRAPKVITFMRANRLSVQLLACDGSRKQGPFFLGHTSSHALPGLLENSEFKESSQRACMGSKPTCRWRAGGGSSAARSPQRNACHPPGQRRPFPAQSSRTLPGGAQCGCSPPCTASAHMHSHDHPHCREKMVLNRGLP